MDDKAQEQVIQLAETRLCPKCDFPMNTMLDESISFCTNRDCNYWQKNTPQETPPNTKLTFNLNTKYFNLFSQGVKDIEYRELNKYWKVRVEKLKVGDRVALAKGYTNTIIIREVVSIDLIKYEDLPEQLKSFFTNQGIYYYAIKLKEPT
ncbi:hypothetical protein A3K72_00695 [Candidatus Woesearchaeota archaeon RBG_13_36_6]|nr:MAG: hypothetical protein A3K72_00695 [Candidatus Woesearchaeota archaeon RBG_13_36_6]